MEYEEWRKNPGTREFRKRVEEMIADTLSRNTLNPENADLTQAMTAKKVGRIEAFEEVIEEIRGEPSE
uniref:Uncharacterized protein n=1 Tax=viral metagenome TaxID=1070528 RepID=A0A6M3JJI6_9ZZZZ